jgi:hypothetical protein
MKQDIASDLHCLSQRMLRVGTRAGQKAGDIAHEAIRQWASIWHQVLGQSGYSPALHDTKPSREQIAGRAYEIWKLKGCPRDTAEEDWKQAERQLTAY